MIVTQKKYDALQVEFEKAKKTASDAFSAKKELKVELDSERELNALRMAQSKKFIEKIAELEKTIDRQNSKAAKTAAYIKRRAKKSR